MTTIIVGAGLSGLYAAWCLHGKGDDVVVLEARDRPGGRILSQAASGAETKFDLGPTWFWPEFQPKLPALLTELKVESFEQWNQGRMVFEPPEGLAQTHPTQGGQPTSHRMSGGIGALIDALAAAIPDTALKLNCAVQNIKTHGSGVSVKTATGTFEGDRILLALPPRLITETITFNPALPKPLWDQCRTMPTWMAAHAKLVAIYDQPFWRDAGLSGHAFSYRGPMMEIHDASPDGAAPYALFGFIGIPAQDRRGQSQEIIQSARAQLERLFGDAAGVPLDILYKDWSTDAMTASAADMNAPNGHPEYGLTDDTGENWRGKLRFIGSETAPQNGGYLEGCLEVVDQWLQSQGIV